MDFPIPHRPEDRTPPAGPDLAAPTRPAMRLFLYEPGWSVGLKVGSERVFCYVMAPGQDYYHRLIDGELYLYNHEERLCFACAERRGLISYTPRGLRPAYSSVALEAPPTIEALPLVGEVGEDD